jgi:hypothetical protein
MIRNSAQGNHQYARTSPPIGRPNSRRLSGNRMPPQARQSCRVRPVILPMSRTLQGRFTIRPPTGHSVSINEDNTQSRFTIFSVAPPSSAILPLFGLLWRLL